MFFRHGKWVALFLAAALLFSGCGSDAADLSFVAQESVSSGDLDAANDLTADGSDAGVSGNASDAGEVYSLGQDAGFGEDSDNGSASDESGGKNGVLKDSSSSGSNSAEKNAESAESASDSASVNDSSSSAKDSSLAGDEKSAAKKSSRAAKRKARRASSDTADEDVSTCTIAIECTRLLSHMDSLKESKVDFVPEDGVILPETEVTFSEGDSVYDILYRVCADNKIHMEASYTPAYNAYYVEGINQLYEFDCGNLSGWMYFVNGESPNYGCSKVTAQPGDEIVWRYTCDSGRDLE